MVKKEFVIKNACGIHLRPAQLLCAAVGSNKVKASIIHKDKTINSKSIVSLLSAGISCGDVITVECSGEYESTALNEIERLIESGFGEGTVC